MGKMKYLFGLIQDQEFYNFKNAVNVAKHKGETEVTFRGRTLTLIQAEASLTIMMNHLNSET
tara:strand:- start:1892 stop:2077 length:186 start_codon:yes stop_codon:yes gene_type:complete